jgi:hypothetical protein
MHGVQRAVQSPCVEFSAPCVPAAGPAPKSPPAHPTSLMTCAQPAPQRMSGTLMEALVPTDLMRGLPSGPAATSSW